MDRSKENTARDIAKLAGYLAALNKLAMGDNYGMGGAMSGSMSMPMTDMGGGGMSGAFEQLGTSENQDLM